MVDFLHVQLLATTLHVINERLLRALLGVGAVLGRMARQFPSPPLIPSISFR